MLSIDFETASTVDLRRSGVFPYARHKDTRVLCMAYAFNDGPVSIWKEGEPVPQKVIDHVDAGGNVRAWNAQFEYEIWNNCFLPQLGLPSAHKLNYIQVYDTMADGAYFGLPLGLDQAAQAAGTSHMKDKDGHALMMRMNKPRTKEPLTWWHEQNPEKFQRLCDYCKQDVEVERAVKKSIRHDLPPSEREMWILDQRINARGLALDTNLIERMETVADDAKKLINTELNTLTNGKVPTVGSAAAMLTFLQNNGLPEIDNLRKHTVVDLLADPELPELVRSVLQLRQDGSKTSVAKLPAMLQATSADTDGVLCVRGMLQYYGAFRTGRWAGRLIQPQNMPRPALTSAEIELAIKYITDGANAETLELLLNAPAMEIVSSLLRSVLVARPDHKLVVYDFSQIEARVLPWLADEQDTLDVFRRGEDIYQQAAGGIYNKPPSTVTKDERQIGKVAILALGFGGGKGAFQTMAANYGLSLPDEQAENIKVAWRGSNPKVVQFWRDLDVAFRSACADKSNSFKHKVGKVTIARWGAHVVIVLPSKRGLFYRNAALETDEEGKVGSTYMGLNQYTRKWERLRTYGGKLAENITQAVARDCMAEVMKAADKQGIETLLTVHDELITEAKNDRADWQSQTLERLMTTPPAWAVGLPTMGDGWVGDRYRK